MKKIINNLDVNYTHTVGFTADVGGRGFHLPRDLALNSENKLYVVSRSGAFHTAGLRISICDIENNYYGEFSKFGKNPGELYWPCSIAFDSKDNVYISDEYTNLISIFDKDGNFIKRWGTKGQVEGCINFPSGIDIDDKDHIYLADNMNDRIQVFSLDGEFIRTWGKEG
ncbi:MAG: NHL repeat-containing protein, partial [Chloroflexota bacterium]|nr:NHL repeat-containing protein [Chloroflexota bacterium]MEC9107454.1 NHL repeat-containing protein [Chloroflexota bacterium]